MADAITLTLEGGEKLNMKLQQIELKVRKKIRGDAVRAGAKLVLETAKSNAAGRVGGHMGEVISKSLQLKVGKAKAPSHYFVRVQHNPKDNNEFVGYSMGSASLLGGTNAKGRSTRGKLVGGKRHYIPNAIEYGHAGPGNAGGPKTVAPISYLRPAFDSNVGRAESLIRMKLFDGIERAFNVG